MSAAPSPSLAPAIMGSSPHVRESACAQALAPSPPESDCDCCTTSCECRPRPTTAGETISTPKTSARRASLCSAASSSRSDITSSLSALDHSDVDTVSDSTSPSASASTPTTPASPPMPLVSSIDTTTATATTTTPGAGTRSTSDFPSLSHSQSADFNPAISLPFELYRPIFAHVTSLNDLRTLSIASRVTQPDAERLLHASIVSYGITQVARRARHLAKFPRIGLFVKSIVWREAPPPSVTADGSSAHTSSSNDKSWNRSQPLPAFSSLITAALLNTPNLTHFDASILPTSALPSLAFRSPSSFPPSMPPSERPMRLLPFRLRSFVHDGLVIGHDSLNFFAEHEGIRELVLNPFSYYELHEDDEYYRRLLYTVLPNLRSVSCGLSVAIRLVEGRPLERFLVPWRADCLDSDQLERLLRAVGGGSAVPNTAVEGKSVKASSSTREKAVDNEQDELEGGRKKGLKSLVVERRFASREGLRCVSKYLGGSLEELGIVMPYDSEWLTDLAPLKHLRSLALVCPPPSTPPSPSPSLPALELVANDLTPAPPVPIGAVIIPLLPAPTTSAIDAAGAAEHVLEPGHAHGSLIAAVSTVIAIPAAEAGEAEGDAEGLEDDDEDGDEYEDYEDAVTVAEAEDLDEEDTRAVEDLAVRHPQTNPLSGAEPVLHPFTMLSPSSSSTITPFAPPAFGSILTTTPTSSFSTSTSSPSIPGPSRLNSSGSIERTLLHGLPSTMLTGATSSSSLPSMPVGIAPPPPHPCEICFGHRHNASTSTSISTSSTLPLFSAAAATSSTSMTPTPPFSFSSSAPSSSSNPFSESHELPLSPGVVEQPLRDESALWYAERARERERRLAALDKLRAISAGLEEVFIHESPNFAANVTATASSARTADGMGRVTQLGVIAEGSRIPLTSFASPSFLMTGKTMASEEVALPAPGAHAMPKYAAERWVFSSEGEWKSTGWVDARSLVIFPDS